LTFESVCEIFNSSSTRACHDEATTDAAETCACYNAEHGIAPVDSQENNTAYPPVFNYLSFTSTSLNLITADKCRDPNQQPS